jgi:hypothetical protein
VTGEPPGTGQEPQGDDPVGDGDGGGDGGNSPTLQCSVPTSKIFDGGVGRDGIPALTNPLLGDADVGVVRGDDRVLGLVIDGAARAYPLPVFWIHEVVNDTLGGRPVLVSYCPLTGSGLAFDPRVGGELRTFGVSGLIYENNLMMFDRQTGNIWNQLSLGAVCGPARGTSLPLLPAVETTWRDWRGRYPGTTVVIDGLGPRPETYPYGDYDEPDNPVTLFPSSQYGEELPPKALVLGVWIGREAVAYSFAIMAGRGSAAVINDVVGGQPIVVLYSRGENAAWAFHRKVRPGPGATPVILSFALADPDLPTFTDELTGSEWNSNGEAIAGPLTGARLDPVVDAYTLYWFAWSVYHSSTRVTG